jgi:hypothetical protein
MSDAPRARRRSLARDLGIAGGLAACAIAGLMLANYSGFCIGQMRFLGEEEIIDTAIGDVIAKQRSRIVTRTPDEPVPRTLPYDSVAQFKSENPACCKIVPHNSGLEVKLVTLAHRIWGEAASTVSIAYVRNYVDVDGSSKSATVRAQPVIGNCGKVLNLGY